MKSDIWGLKSGVYGKGRTLPGIRLILESENRRLKDLTREISTGPGVFLDIGSGEGNHFDVLPESGVPVCMDRSFGMARRMKRLRGNVICADACFIPVRTRAILFVSAVGLTEYIQEKNRFLKEVKRILQPGGCFLSTISPPGLLNILRNLLGSRIHPIRAEAWEALAISEGFTILGKNRSLIQIQYLLGVED